MFKPIKNDTGAPTPWEYLPCGKITPKAGLALTMTEGKLALASGSTAPSYLCMQERESAAADGETIPVIRVEPGNIYETSLSADGAGLKLGDKVTISADGLEATATTESGVAEIVAIVDPSAGGTVYVRFGAEAAQASEAV